MSSGNSFCSDALSKLVVNDGSSICSVSFCIFSRQYAFCCFDKYKHNKIINTVKGESFTLRCEVCGHKIHDEPITAVIEGAKLTVCVECSKHGKIIHEEEVALPQKSLKKTQAPVTMVQRKPIVAKVEITQELAEDYAK